MTDTVHSFRSPIYAATAKKRLPPSFYVGLGVAALIHVGLAWYLINQTFTAPIIDLPEGPIISTPIYNPPKEQPKPTPPHPQPQNTIKVHEPPVDAPPTTDEIPLTPAKPDDTVASSATSIVTDGTATSSASTSSSAYVKARWTRFPDGAALSDYYPPRAAEDEMEGTATVQCTVMDAKGRVTCVTVSETPKGYGFGKQTEKMIESIGRVDTSQGDVQVGSQLLTTVKWTLQ